MNWTPSDGSRERQEASSSWDVGAAPFHERDARRRHNNGLQAINDADFEALIEILGTSGQDKASDLNVQSLLNNEERSADFEEEGSSVMTVRGPPAPSQVDRRSAEQRESAPSPPPLVAVADTSEPVSILDLPGAEPTSPSHRHVEAPPPAGSSNTRIPGPSKAPVNSKSERRPKSPKNIERAESETGFGYTRLSEELSSTVKETKDSIAELRLRLQTLKDEVRGFAPHLYHKAFEGREDAKQPGSSKLPTRDHVENPVVPPRPSSRNGEQAKKNLMTKLEEEISEMNNEEIRTVLAKVCFSMGLSPAALKSSPTAVTPPNCPPQELNDANRAIGFLSDVDYLVWRRKRRPSGVDDRDNNNNNNNKDSEAQNLYTEQNITAMFDRIRLWERTARTSVRRQTTQNVANSSQTL